MTSAIQLRAEDLRGYVDYLRDLGIFDLYAVSAPSTDEALLAWVAGLEAASPAGVVRRAPEVRVKGLSAPPQPRVEQAVRPAPPSPFERSVQRSSAPAARSLSAAGLRPAGPQITIAPPMAQPVSPLDAQPFGADSMHDIVEGEMTPVSFNLLSPMPADRPALADRASALQALRADIGDCTRCPLAYAGRHTIVFGDGDPNARLLFVGEGPGADEDESGIPFVGKAGQLLNNMIGAMGLKRESVYIANVVKCRPPKNRTPEPVEAGTCSQFLLRQIDIVQPQVIVALGATAATYLLGVKQSLASLRGQWFDVRGAKCAVTYHPAYLLRDPRQKGEAWKDLQRVMVEMNLTPPARG